MQFQGQKNYSSKPNRKFEVQCARFPDYLRAGWWCLWVVLCLSNCATSAGARKARQLKNDLAQSDVFARSLTGFALLDPNNGKYLIDYQGDKYFTPASNTKILTLATCLRFLPDTLPRLKYQYGEDSSTGEGMGIVGVYGTGDPTFLHPDFKAWQTVPPFVKEHPHGFAQVFSPDGFQRQRPWGPGWSWDDFTEDYSCEISSLPVFGNLIQAEWDQKKWIVSPPLFSDSTVADFFVTTEQRKPFSNVLQLPQFSKPDERTTRYYPMFGAERLAPVLLQDTLHYLFYIPEAPIYTVEPKDLSVWYATPLDTVLRRMMHQSDNFIAEQLLLMCAGRRFNSLRQDTLLQYMVDSVWNSLPQRPKWVDGSGLSRYNLISPKDLTQVLLELWKNQPTARLLSLFPAGGVSGTLQEWYPGKNGKPYVFAKTGGMSGVHCLSGYVVCRSGKTLIFSFMHNNFIGTNKPWKQEMQRLLERIAERW